MEELLKIFQKQWSELKETYQSIWQAAPLWSEAFETLHRQVHRLKGDAQLMQFTGMHQLAQGIENLLETFPDTGEIASEKLARLKEGWELLSWRMEYLELPQRSEEVQYLHSLQ